MQTAPKDTKIPYLECKNVFVSYDSLEALHGISFIVNKGEIVTILGANGAGKTTTLTAISGLLSISSGSIIFDGEPIHTLQSFKIVRRGITQSPEGRRVFGTLSVLENLYLGAFTKTDKKEIIHNLEWIYTLFPRLKERRTQLAGTLSGGEQQMLAIGRALMGSPKLLLLDEPSLGLAPILVENIFNAIKEINASGLTVLLVEQNAKSALKLAHRGIVMEVGNIVLEGSAESLLNNPAVQQAYLGQV